MTAGWSVYWKEKVDDEWQKGANVMFDPWEGMDVMADYLGIPKDLRSWSK